MTLPSSWIFRWCAALTAITCPLGTAEAHSKPASGHSPAIDIPAMPLPRALEALAAMAGVSIGTDGPLPAVGAHAVRHARSAAEALSHLLDGTGYTSRQVSVTAWRITRAPTAQPTPPPAAQAPRLTTDDPTIVVTASKQDIALFNLPQAASVLRVDIATRRDPARDTGFVATEVEGLTLTSDGPGRNRLFMRGVADSPYSDSNQSPVTVVLDNSRLTFSAPDPDLRLVDVERIELLQGPQGTLYGIGSLGGIYHIVTAKPDVDHFDASVSAGVNMVAHGQLGESGSAVVNLPVFPGNVGLRLVAYGSREGGWIDTTGRPNGNTSKLAGGRAALGIETGGSWNINFSGVHQRINTADSQYNYAPGMFLRPAQLAEPTDNDLDHAAGHVTGRIGGITVALDGGYTWHEVSDTFDATIGATSFGLPHPSLFTDAKTYHVGEVELRLNGRLGPMHWLLGATHTDSREQDIRQLASSDPVAPLTIDTAHRTARETGAFVSIGLPVLSRLSLDLGARAYHAFQESRFLVSDNDTTQTLAKWYVTPSASLTWKAKATRVFYLHFGTANRPGGLDFGESEDITAINGDTLRSVEAGWREKLPGGGSLDANSFMIWWNNIQSDHVLSNGLIAANNAGNARIFGGEASLTLPLGRDWRLASGLTVQKTVLVNNAEAPATQSTMPRVPALTLRGSLAHDFALGAVAAHVRVGLHYSSPARLSFDPVLGRSTGPLLETALDAGMEWRRTRFDLRLNNPLNRIDNRFAFGNPFRINLPQYTPQKPISGSLTLSRDF